MAERNSWEALSDSTRREILLLLRDAPCSAGQISERFSISKPSISHHLNLLREAGLVRSEKKGQHIFYTLVPEAFAPLREYLALFPADAAESSPAKPEIPTKVPEKMPEKPEEAPDRKRSAVPVYLY